MPIRSTMLMALVIIFPFACAGPAAPLRPAQGIMDLVDAHRRACTGAPATGFDHPALASAKEPEHKPCQEGEAIASVSLVRPRPGALPDWKIIRTLNLQLGQPFAQSAVSQALKRLWDLRSFFDLEVRGQPSKEGCALEVGLWEKPVTGQIFVEGETALMPSQAAQALGLQKGLHVQLEVAQSGIARLTGDLFAQGYLDANTALSMQEQDGRADFCLQVTPGPAYQARLTFRGNHNVDTADLLTCLGLPPDGQIAFEKIDNLRNHVFECYADRGYAMVGLEQKSKQHAESRELELVMEVEEGIAYQLGEITFEGALADSVARYQELLELKADELFSRRRLLDAIGRLDRFHKEKKKNLRVIVDTQLDQDRRRIHLLFRMWDEDAKEMPQ